MAEGRHIFWSDGASDMIRETGERSENVDLVLRKPVRLEDLRRAIEDVVRVN